MKKGIIVVAFVLGILSFAHAQKNINETIEVKNQETEMKLSFADDIVIEAWNKDVVEVQVEVDIDDNKYNDQYTLEISEKNGRILIVEEIDFDEIKKQKGDKKNFNCETTINYALKVPQNLKMKLETISGEIEIIGCQGEMSVKSISGFIDYAIPQSHKAKIELSTVTGEVYSNLKFDKKQPEKISWVGTNQELSLNGGNTAVDLKTVSGDIYLRKR